MPTPLLDSLIYTGIALLILSQISEKITTFLRTYIHVVAGFSKNEKPRKGTRFMAKTTKKTLAFLAALDDVSDLSKSKIKKVGPNEQPKVEFAISKLSLLIGFFIAFSFKADLFWLLASGQMPHEGLGWRGAHLCLERACFWKDCWYILTVLPGCFATGFLLTFGSKFFHDLLETLYGLRNLSQKAGDKSVYLSPNNDVLGQRLAPSHQDPVKKVFERHKERLLRDFQNIVSIAMIFDSDGYSMLEIRLSDANMAKIEQYNFDYLEGGEVKTMDKAKINWFLNAAPVKPMGDVKLLVGDWTFNNATPDNQGTLGFFATRSGAPVLVTCYHALRTPQHAWEGLGAAPPDFNRVFAQPASGPHAVNIGTLVDGTINDWMDCAVVALDASVDFANIDPVFGPFSVKETASAGVGAAIQVNGATSEPGYGTVRSIENCVRIDYGDRIRALYDLVCLENTGDPTRSLTQKGDSGAVVLDMDENAVAMVVAGDDHYTYAVPIKRMMQAFELG